MKTLFGTDGMRGAAGKFPLDAATIRDVGRSLAQRFRNELGRTPKFVSGRDTRESGDWIERALHEGAVTEGAEFDSAGVITTPGVAFVANAFGFDAGIVISASHNPFEDNGIKIFSPTGKKLDAATERMIEEDILSWRGLSEQGHRGFSPRGERSAEFQEAYLDYLAEEFKNLKLGDFRMVIDCANGAASELALRLFGRFGAEMIVINHQPDGRNINLNCGSLHLERVREVVLQSGASFGVAFDGDADRALFVDENGEIVDGDAVLWIMAQFLSEHDRLSGNRVVATVMSNIGLELALKSRGIELARTAVGDKYVLDELLASGAAVGGEQSGHIIFPQRGLVGDGMKTALYLLESLYEHGATLSEMARGFTRYPQILVNVGVAEKRPFEEVEAIAAASAELERELDGNGRLLLRYSGTENLARVMIEGKDQSQIEIQANRLASVIKDSLG